MPDGGGRAVDPLWTIRQDRYDARRSGRDATVFTTANGYRSLRGCLPFERTDAVVSLIAGVFDKAEAAVTELARCPDPTHLRFFIAHRPALFDEGTATLVERVLDLRAGCCRTHAELAAGTASAVTVRLERFVSMGNRHRWAETMTLRAWHDPVRLLIASGIDGSGRNNERSPLDATTHFEVHGRYDLSPGVMLDARTRDAGIVVVEAHRVAAVGSPERLERIRWAPTSAGVEEVYALDLEPGVDTVIVRYGMTWTSRDMTGFVAGRCERELDRFIAEGRDDEFSIHAAAWGDVWKTADVRIEGDETAQRAIRFNLFQLASSASRHDERLSIGARGIHGEGYKGHVFWDTEIFMLPFFLFTQPAAARAALRYRFLTLEGARRNARETGFRGARFAWESAVDGTEETPRWGVDYTGKRVRIWTGDKEVHISPDIAYAICLYAHATGDLDFMRHCGYPILYEIALFLASLARREADGRWHIRGVIGPDEFHEDVDDNAYTNCLARWALRAAFELDAELARTEPSLRTTLRTTCGVTDEDVRSFAAIAAGITVPRQEGTGIIEQFEGYFQLPEFPITGHDPSGLPAWPDGVPLDRLGQTSLVKQADAIQLLALLGDEFDRPTREATFDYYLARTMHKSSLSPSMYAMVGIGLGRTAAAHDSFMRTLLVDLEDNQGNTDDGLHAASAGGAWQCAVFGFGGFSPGLKGLPSFSPWLPDPWRRLSYTILWRGTRIDVTADTSGMEVAADQPVELMAYGRRVALREPGRKVRVDR